MSGPPVTAAIVAGAFALGAATAEVFRRLVGRGEKDLKAAELRKRLERQLEYRRGLLTQAHWSREHGKEAEAERLEEMVEEADGWIDELEEQIRALDPKAAFVRRSSTATGYSRLG